MKQAYPLSWPESWPRKGSKKQSAFNRKRSIAAAIDELVGELARLGVPSYNFILSTNVETRRDGYPYSNRKEPSDKGVAVYFNLKGNDHVLACDTWNRVACNIWAIVKHIEALRGQQRWEVGNIMQAFRGYKAIENGNGNRDWWEVLAVGPAANASAIKKAYRERLRATHPDTGTGDRDELQAVKDAYRTCVDKGLV